MKTSTKTHLLLLCCLALFACGTENNNGAGSLSGNWLLLYPDHKLSSAHQREVYGRHQSAVVDLLGLKLLTLAADGSFLQMDSLQKPPGRWELAADGVLKIREGGKGFNPFVASVTSLKNNQLQVTQYLPLEDESIKLVWHWKKIEDGEAAKLFSPGANNWRRPPAAPEDRQAIRQRLVDMLDYYGIYFSLIGKEASYFLQSRLPLPFRYYQHAVGLVGMPLRFQQFFYNGEDAAKAYALLEQAHFALHGKFPQDENFVLEYGRFFRMLADWLRPKTGN